MVKVPLSKLTSFLGKAPIFGEERVVSVDMAPSKAHGLDVHVVAIEVKTLEEGMAVLERLAPQAGVALTATQTATLPPSPPTLKETEALAVSGKLLSEQSMAVLEAAGMVKIITPPPLPQEQTPAVQAAQRRETVTVRGANVVEFVKPGSLPPEIVGSKRFIEVMDFVMKRDGLKPSQAEQIIATLDALKEQVAIVGRARSIREKVEANLQAYAEAGHGG
jgi:hypothetical protein